MISIDGHDLDARSIEIFGGLEVPLFFSQMHLALYAGLAARTASPLIGLLRTSLLTAMAQGPKVSRHVRDLRRGQLRATHRGHWRSILLWVRHPDGDGVGDRSEAAIAPQPLAACEIGSLGTAFGVRSVASGAWRARDLAVEDPPAERNRFRR